MITNKTSVTVVMPAKNESGAIGDVVKRIVELVPHASIIVVDDGSSDTTAAVAAEAGAQVICHPYSKGNGAAIKTGARAVTGDVVVFMDADGQHSPEDVPRLLAKLDEGYDLVIGARTSASQASPARGIANRIYNTLASYMTGHKVPDLTSGFRAVNVAKFRAFIYLLPNGFSYPTTSTMAFFRAGHSVAFVPITAHARIGKSHIRLVRDGVRFFLVIFKIGSLYSPLKIFFPVSLAFMASGMSYYLFTYLISGRFTNMSMLLFSSAVIVFLIGLISEQITNLMYKDN